jgi:hypothetical protein
MAFVDASPRSAQATARGETLVLEFGRELMFGVSSAVIRKLFRNLAAIIACRLRATNQLLGPRPDALTEPILTGKDLTGTDLSGCILAGVPAREADLRGADLRGADMRGADLRGVDLRGARMEGAVLDPGEASATPEGAERDGPPTTPVEQSPERERRVRGAWSGHRPQDRGAARSITRTPSTESDGPRFITSARRTLRTQGMTKPLSEAITQGPDAVSDYWKGLMKRGDDEESTTTESETARASNARQRRW